MSAWSIASLILQVVGLVTTAAGLSLTWRAFHDPHERFRDEFIDWARRVAARIPWPRRRRHVGANAELSDAIGLAGQVTARVAYGPLPTDVDEALALLNRRVESVRNDLSSTQSEAAARFDGQETRLDRLEGRVATEVARLDKADQRVATDGIHLESVGLVLVAIGVLCQLIGGLT